VSRYTLTSVDDVVLGFRTLVGYLNNTGSAKTY